MEKLLRSPLNVFSVNDLASLWQIKKKQKIWSLIRYYLRVKKLKKLYKGIYTLGDYQEFELAQKLVTPSYISFYSALAVHGIIFQYYSSVHSMAVISKRIQVNKKEFIYHQLKESVFYDSLGIKNNDTYSIAGPERAICDSLYLAPGLYFDSFEKVNFDKLKKVSQIYNNKRLEKEVAEIIKLNKNHA